MSNPPLVAVKLPVRTTARKPTDKAIKKLQATTTLPSGRPIPDGVQAAKMLDTLLAHTTLAESRASISRQIEYLKGQISSASQPKKSATPVLIISPLWGMNTQNLQKQLDDNLARLAELPKNAEFPKDMWDDFLAQPDESLIVKMLLSGTSSYYYSTSFGPQLFQAYLAEQNICPTNLTEYAKTNTKNLSLLWAALVKRAFADAASEKLEFTPLIDALWQVHSVVKKSIDKTLDIPLTISGPKEPVCPKCVEILSSSPDRSFVERAMNFKSKAWRRMVTRSSKAFSDPDILLDCLNTFDAEGVQVLVTNPALSKETINLLHEWAMYHLTQPYRPLVLPPLLDGLEETGHPLTDAHIYRIHSLLRFERDVDFRIRLSALPQVSRHPLIFNELIQTDHTDVWKNLAAVATGPIWLTLLAKANETSDLRTLAELLKNASPDQLAGLTRRSFVPWLRHEDKNIRINVMSLIRSLPDGPAPELPPLPKKRKRIR